MTRRRSECEILRPALVALVHDEPHPEARKVVNHLRRCSRCSEEERELRATRGWIEAAAAVAPALSGGPDLSDGLDVLDCRKASIVRWRRRLSSLLSPSSHLVSAAALAFVAFVLFSRGAPEPAPASWIISRASSAASAAVAPARMAVHSFSGRELDDRIDLVESKLAFLDRDSLEGPSW